MKRQNLIDTLIESLSIVPEMLKIFSKIIRHMQCVPCEQLSISSLLPNEQIDLTVGTCIQSERQQSISSCKNWQKTSQIQIPAVIFLGLFGNGR